MQQSTIYRLIHLVGLLILFSSGISCASNSLIIPPFTADGSIPMGTPWDGYAVLAWTSRHELIGLSDKGMSGMHFAAVNVVNGRRRSLYHRSRMLDSLFAQKSDRTIVYRCAVSPDSHWMLVWDYYNVVRNNAKRPISKIVRPLGRQFVISVDGSRYQKFTPTFRDTDYTTYAWLGDSRHWIEMNRHAVSVHDIRSSHVYTVVPSRPQGFQFTLGGLGSPEVVGVVVQRATARYIIVTSPLLAEKDDSENVDIDTLDLVNRDVRRSSIIKPKEIRGRKGLFQISMSPDGSRIAWILDTHDGFEIWSSYARHPEASMVAKCRVVPFLVWSPDSARFAYSDIEAVHVITL